jgi:hypothetical protein
MTGLLVDRRGNVLCLYGEEIDLAAIGALRVRRASHVEPDPLGLWWADLCPVGGPRLGPFGRRSEALVSEGTWLVQNLHLIGEAPITPAEERISQPSHP